MSSAGGAPRAYHLGKYNSIQIIELLPALFASQLSVKDAKKRWISSTSKNFGENGVGSYSPANFVAMNSQHI